MTNIPILTPGTPFTLPKGVKTWIYGTAVNPPNTLILIPSARGRALGLSNLTIDVSPNNYEAVDGDLWSQAQAKAGQFLILVGANLFPNTLNFLSGYVSGGSGLSSALGSDNWSRLLEKISSLRTGSFGNYVDESVAAAGSGSVTFSVSTPGYLHVSAGISQDTLGTSPHASYLKLNDPNGSTMFGLKGAVIPYAMSSLRAPLTGTYTLEWLNGDSVAHWFFCEVYVVGS